MQTNNHLSIKNLNVWYGKHQTLNDINVDIPDNKITAIIGPSGCGKTTLLKSFNRLIELQDDVKIQGQIFVDGENIFNPKFEIINLRKKMGLLLQRPSVLPMSIFDNVAYGPRIHGNKDKKKTNYLVENYLKIVGLWDEVKDRLKSSAGKLSIGQQQRLCLARALAVEPEIILADEPTSALDPVSAQNIEEELFKLKKSYTIVLVTHSIHQAKRLADYVIHLYLGKIVEQGEANTLFKNPQQERTKAYINGTFYRDLKIDKEINLKGKICPLNFVYTKLELDKIEDGKILKVIVDDETAVNELPRGVEFDGHKVLKINQINETDYEIIIQKQEAEE